VTARPRSPIVGTALSAVALFPMTGAFGLTWQLRDEPLRESAGTPTAAESVAAARELSPDRAGRSRA
jgi:hypothetical protein